MQARSRPQRSTACDGSSPLMPVVFNFRCLLPPSLPKNALLRESVVVYCFAWEPSPVWNVSSTAVPSAPISSLARSPSDARLITLVALTATSTWPSSITPARSAGECFMIVFTAHPRAGAGAVTNSSPVPASRGVSSGAPSGIVIVGTCREGRACDLLICACSASFRLTAPGCLLDAVARGVGVLLMGGFRGELTTDSQPDVMVGAAEAG